jgi:hypothetical protein
MWAVENSGITQLASNNKSLTCVKGIIPEKKMPGTAGHFCFEVCAVSAELE